jgi:hypothetical protein
MSEEPLRLTFRTLRTHYSLKNARYWAWCVELNQFWARGAMEEKAVEALRLMIEAGLPGQTFVLFSSDTPSERAG